MPDIQLQSAMPGFAVADLARSLEFYNGLLGFATIFMNGPENAPIFAIVKRGQVIISLASNVDAERVGRGACYLSMTGIDGLYAEIKALGVAMTHDLRDESYGMREFMITDPDGNTINFGEEN